MKSSCRFFVVSLVIVLAIGSIGLFAAQKAAKQGKLSGLAHINILTRDLERSIKFYQDNLKFTVVSQAEISRPEGVTRIALVRQGNCVVEFAQPPQPETVPDKVKGVIGHFAIEVRNIDLVAAGLKAKGISLDREVTTLDTLFGGSKVAFLSGPSGESIELFEYLNKPEGLKSGEKKTGKTGL
jgi:catechol 2,3-dioxygenase-like lactoylglutathione lyase family enzyme